MDVLRRLALLVACSAALGAACSDGASSGDDGTGGDGGNGGEGGRGGGNAGGKAGSGGKGGSQGGSGGGGGAGGSVGDAGTDPDASTKPPRPEPVVEAYAAPTAKLPVMLDFAKADDLAKNFHVVGAATHDAAEGGRVRIAKGKPTVLVFDTKPDTERTDTVESFTAWVKYRADRQSTVWFTFASDKNRNDALAAGFHWDNGRDGPPGVSDVDGVYFHRKCWATEVSERGPDCIAPTAQAYGWTYAEPGPTVYTLKITVKADKATSTVKVRSELIDDGGVIDGQSYTWTGVPRINGELSFGVDSREADAFIDAVSIGAPETIKEPSFVTLDDSPLHLWVPDNLPAGAKLKGLLHTDPGLTMAPDGEGDFALFEHLRQFARTHGWGLLGGASGAPKSIPAFKADLAKLATKATRPEINTVPLFMESLLDTLEYQAVADDELAKRLIGFFANKPRLGGDINAGTAEGYEQYPVSSIGRKVPGFACYSNLPASIAQRTTVMGFWYQQRFFEKVEGATKTPDYALWTMVGHGPQTHAVVDSWQLYLAFLQELIKLRTKNNDGTTPLAPVQEAGGFLGLYEGIFLKDGQHTSPIVPFAPAGWPPTPPPVDQVSKPQQNFLVGPSTALVWQAFQYYRLERMPGVAGVNWVPKRAFWTTVPRHGKAGESRLMKLGFAADLTWKKIEFFDGATVTKDLVPLKVVEAGGTPEMNYTNLAPGIHNFIARVTGGDGAVHLTHPVGVVLAP